MLDHLIAFLRATLASTRAERHPLATEFDAPARLPGADGACAWGRGCRRARPARRPLRTLPVPPLLLQPLVENAIKHGLEPQVEGGRIEVARARPAAGAAAGCATPASALGRPPAPQPPAPASAWSRCASGWHTLYGERGRADAAPRR
jgi:hypothetical protein